MLEATGQSIFGLFYRVVDNKMEFLVHTKSEVGCFDKIELGPSVQLGPKDKEISIIDKFFLENIRKNKNIDFSGLFSEEGGRFYQEQNKNILIKVDYNIKLPDGYFWADFQTLNILIQFNNCLNIQLRNLLSILKL